MFCPTCGAKSPDQSGFCRSCGTDLGLISDALSGRLLDLRMLEADKTYQKDLFRGALFVLVLILAILAILKFTVGGIDQDSFGPLVLILSWMAAALTLANLLLARHRRKIHRLLLEKELGTPTRTKETARLPEPEPVPPPSVTEHTTTRLSQEVAIKERGREYE